MKAVIGQSLKLRLYLSQKSAVWSNHCQTSIIKAGDFVKKGFFHSIFHYDPDKVKRVMLLFSIICLFSFTAIVQNESGKMEKGTQDFNLNQDPSKLKMEYKIRGMVKGYPIERMAGQIARKDKATAAYLVAIAKKESDWGKHVPVLNGEDCFNYWGFRRISDKMGSDGHTCFTSPKEAVNAVAGRINELVFEYKRESPEEMVVWKCGYDCAGDGGADDKWVSDVNFYYEKLIN
jgi:hypothetical protein